MVDETLGRQMIPEQEILAKTLRDGHALIGDRLVLPLRDLLVLHDLVSAGLHDGASRHGDEDILVLTLQISVGKQIGSDLTLQVHLVLLTFVVQQSGGVLLGIQRDELVFLLGDVGHVHVGVRGLHISVLLAGEHALGSDGALSVTVLAGLGNAHFQNLARTTADHTDGVLLQITSRTRLDQTGTVIGSHLESVPHFKELCQQVQLDNGSSIMMQDQHQVISNPRNKSHATDARTNQTI